MTERRDCAVCGSPLTSSGLCPRCLLRLGIEEVSEAKTATAPPRPAPEDLGTIGVYRLLSVIGEGGMGIVYLAEQKEPIRRRVALKVIKRGMDSREVIARFESERQALALMSHPNIARVLEAGTTDSGVPFFVMEYVAGIPITEYCDKYRLDARQRLELFVPVCQAAQHAHQKGIIHRDIKPSNVLISVEDERPRPKVIDFGVAKAVNQRLTEKTLFTEQGILIGTPGYMSPEQAEMTALDIDTRTDIYSLGVLLYELMAGALPFDAQRLRRAGYLEMQRIIREEEPPKPSTRVSGLGARATEVAQRRRTDPRALARQLRGDLDWITLKSLEKDRTRRYQSATELALDVQRHLAGEPVAAGPPGAAYRLRKLVRRHRLLFAAAAAVFAALLAGAIVSTIQYVRAEDARKDARRQLMGLHVATGMRLVDEGDFFGSLPWLVRALTLEEGGPEQIETHRRRIGAVLAQCPRLVGLWPSGQWSYPFAALSPDGRSVAAGGEDNTARVWSVATGEPLTPPLPHRKAISGVRFSPDGRYVATGSEDGSAQIWDAATGGPLSPPLAHEAAVKFLAFSPDGRQLAAASEDGSARVWKTPTGRSLLTVRHDGPVTHVVFARGGKVLVSGSLDGTVRAWNVATGQPLFPPIRHRAAVYSLAVSPDGERVASASVDWTARVWSLKDGTAQTPPLRHGNPVAVVRFSPDGQWVATAAWDKTAGVWNARTGQPRYPLLPHDNALEDVVFSPDGRLLVTATGDKVTLWDAAGGVRAGPQLRGQAVSLEVDRAGRFLLATGDRARLWDLAGGEPEDPPMRHAQQIRGLDASPDGRRLLTYVGIGHEHEREGYAQVWDTQTSEPVTPPLRHARMVPIARFSPDGRRVVTGSLDRTARTWNAMDGEPLTAPLEHPKLVTAVQFSPDGRRIVTGAGEPFEPASNDFGVTRVWDAVSGNPLTDFIRQSPVFVVSFSPDGSRIVAGNTDAVQFWDSRSGRPAGPTLPHPAGGFSVSFSPDGRRVVSSGGDGAVTVWDSSTGRPLAGPFRHSTACKAAFDRDGRRILTTSGDGTARLWDAQSGAPLTPPLEHQGLVYAGSLSSDGRFVVTGSLDSTARVWDAGTGEPVTPRYRHGGAVWGAVFLSSRRIATASQDRTARLWDLPVEDAPTEALEELASLLAGRRLQSGGALVTAESGELQRSWTRLRKDHPELFAVSPGKTAAWHRRQAEELIEEHRWLEALPHLDTFLQWRPANWRARMARGRAYAELGRWEEAAADFFGAFQLRPDDPETAHAHALVQLFRGGREEYRRVRAWLLEKYGQTRNPDRAAWVARTTILAPAENGEAASLAVTLARTALEIRPDQPDLLEIFGAALFRGGRFEEAAQAVKKATLVRGGSSVRADLLLALAGPHRGRGGRTSPSVPPKSTSWRDDLEVQLLRPASGLVGGTR